MNLCDRLDNALDRSEYAGAYVGVFFAEEPFHSRFKFLSLLENAAAVVVLTNPTLVQITCPSAQLRHHCIVRIESTEGSVIKSKVSGVSYLHIVWCVCVFLNCFVQV